MRLVFCGKFKNMYFCSDSPGGGSIKLELYVHDTIGANSAAISSLFFQNYFGNCCCNFYASTFEMNTLRTKNPQVKRALLVTYTYLRSCIVKILVQAHFRFFKTLINLMTFKASDGIPFTLKYYFGVGNHLS